MKNGPLSILKNSGFDRVMLDQDDNIMMIYKDSSVYIKHMTYERSMTIDEYIEYKRMRGISE